MMNFEKIFKNKTKILIFFYKSKLIIIIGMNGILIILVIQIKKKTF